MLSKIQKIKINLNSLFFLIILEKIQPKFILCDICTYEGWQQVEVSLCQWIRIACVLQIQKKKKKNSQKY